MKTDMRSFVFTLLLVTGFSLAMSQERTVSDLRSFHWMEGSWLLDGKTGDKQVLEIWKVNDNHTLNGQSISVSKGDTTILEELQIIFKGKNIYYVADVSHNSAPVLFEMTEIFSNGFTCENPDHDFPTEITYRLDGNTIQAEAAGGDRVIAFRFKRVGQ